MSRRNITVTIYPQVNSFVKAMARAARVFLTSERQMKKLRRQSIIQDKQLRRDLARINRRPALIHNGRRSR